MRFRRALKDSTSLTPSYEGVTFDQLKDRLSAPVNDNAQTTPDPKSLLAQQNFLDAVKQGQIDVQKAREQLEKLREESKKERGFLSKCFSIFASEKPLDKVVNDVAAFDKYCRKNGIKYDEVAQQLVAGEKPPTAWDKIKDYRFLIAAAGGAALGLAGADLGQVPVLKEAPSAFFGGLPWLAAPFIGLNIFKSFSQYSVVKEAPTLLRFLAITTAGFAISIGVTMGMTNMLDLVDPSTMKAAADQAAGGGGFNPMQYMLPIIGGFTAAALAYKRAKSVVANEFNKVTEGKGFKGALSKVYNGAVGLVMNKYTAPAVKWAGEMAEKATDIVNKVFPKYIDIVGIPAVATLMAGTMANGGLGLLGQYGSYYLTAFTGMAVGGLAMAAAYLGCGCRGKDFKEIGHTALTGFSISSSSATMPKEKECLKAIGVSDKTINTVVPLGGVFNMYGTALYMGLTAFYATTLFGADPSLTTYLSTAATVLGIALGAPGIPASNITLLDPVLQQTGLSPAQIHKIYSMVIPADRILDMTQTGLNVLGDMVAAVHTDRHLIKERNRLKDETTNQPMLPPPSAPPGPSGP